MCSTQPFQWRTLGFVFVFLATAGGISANLQAASNPVINTVFPMGSRTGTTIEIELQGTGFQEITSLRFSSLDASLADVGASAADVVSAKRIEGVETKKTHRFRVTIPKSIAVGHYDLYAVTDSGVAAPRPFIISNRQELNESAPSQSVANNDFVKSAHEIPLDTIINGRIERKGDVDHFRFRARHHQRVIIECLAWRIDSRLRAAIEVLDQNGNRLATNRGYFGIDPLIDFRVPADGEYTLKIYDLIHAGGSEYYYRLDLDTGPRVAFTIPAVIQQGKSARLKLFGWNLNGDASQAANQRAWAVGEGQHFESMDFIVDKDQSMVRQKVPFRNGPSQLAIKSTAVYLSGSTRPVRISVTDVPVQTSNGRNSNPSAAQNVAIPSEVSGQLVDRAQHDWYAINVRRGEVLHFEGYAQRIGSPMDMDIRVLDHTAQSELAKFTDEQKNIGGRRFPSAHLDPQGRWVAPSDGQFLVLVRDLIAGRKDARRVYRLSIRREESDFSVAVIPRIDSPAGFNVPRGGRSVFDVFAFRQRGHSTSICIRASQLPQGFSCDDVWVGPHESHATLVMSASRDSSVTAPFGDFRLVASTDGVDDRVVNPATIVRTGTSNGWSRLISRSIVGVAEEAPLRLTANAHERRNHHLYGNLKVRHSPGGILDVAVHIDRADNSHQADVNLIGVELPTGIKQQTAVIPAGKDKGYISFYLPPTLLPGTYSLVVKGETTVPTAKGKTRTVTAFTNAVSFEVKPAAFIVEIDPHAPKQIKRGETIQVSYTAKRINGFISKIHTELATPSKVTDVVGIRGRGVSFVGQSEKGAIQIVANEDAPLGQQPFLRLYAIGTVEDEAVFHGSCFLQLEVVEK